MTLYASSKNYLPFCLGQERQMESEDYYLLQKEKWVTDEGLGRVKDRRVNTSDANPPTNLG